MRACVCGLLGVVSLNCHTCTQTHPCDDFTPTQGYYINNVGLMLMAIVSLAWLLFFLDSSDEGFGTRVDIILTLLLTAVSYKQTICDSLPKIPYLTPLDRYVMFSFGFLYLCLVETALARLLAVLWPSWGRHMDRGCTALLGVLWFGIQFFCLWAIQNVRAQRRGNHKQDGGASKGPSSRVFVRGMSVSVGQGAHACVCVWGGGSSVCVCAWQLDFTPNTLH